MRRLAGVALWGVLSLSAEAAPNILFLFADDQRADTIGAWGNDHIKTPHLDRLSRQGFNFQRNYCFGGNSGAVCVPSRAMLLSGRTWFHTDNKLSKAISLPEHLAANGYATFATGKWHNGEPLLLRCFERAKAIFFGGMCDHTKVPLRDKTEDGKLSETQRGEGFSSEIFADAAIEFLANYREAKPFFAYVAFSSPHDPRQPPEAYRELYDEIPPPLPANFLPQHPFDNGQLKIRDEQNAAWPRTAEVVGEQLRDYYGMVSHLDAQVGRVLKALERSPHSSNTIVVYAADHGLAMGSHGLLGKQSLYEHSMRCPLIIAGPGIPQGQSESFTYLFDLFPTICGLAGIRPPDGLDGLSLKTILANPTARVRDTVFLPYLELMRSIRDEHWKLIVYPPINHRQLFDLANDPDEMHDLAENPTQAANLERLTELLRAKQAEQGDKLPLATDKPKPKAIDLSGQPREPDQWQPDWIVEKYFGKSGRGK